MADRLMQINGVEELNNNIEKFISNLKSAIPDAIERACDRAAQNIQVTYRRNTESKSLRISNNSGVPKISLRTSHSGKGFSDKTGALRGSIQGGFLSYDGEDKAVGVIRAGDDSIGSNGMATKDYVTFVEFGNFGRTPITLPSGFKTSISGGRNTAFLIPGVQENARSVGEYVAKSLDVEKIFKGI